MMYGNVSEQENTIKKIIMTYGNDPNKNDGGLNKKIGNRLRCLTESENRL